MDVTWGETDEGSKLDVWMGGMTAMGTTTEVATFTTEELLKDWKKIKDDRINMAILGKTSRQSLHA